MVKSTYKFSLVTAVCTFFLIVAGALVTSTGSSLSVPDWPLSYGKFFPPMTGGILFEHGHRMIAGFTGILIASQSVLLWMKEKEKWIARIGLIAFLGVLMQALLGGMTVLLKLPRPVSIAHAILAQTIFCLTVSLAVFTSRRWADLSRGDISQSEPVPLRRLFALSCAVTSLIFIQLILGAAFRHGAGSIFLMLHMTLALVIALGVLILFFQVHLHFKKYKELYIPMAGAAIGILLQLLLGTGAFLSMTPSGFSLPLIQERTFIVTAHVALGALILALTLTTALWSARLKSMGSRASRWNDAS